MDFYSGFGVELGCLYSSAGMKAQEKSGDGEVTRRYIYCDVPILFRVAQTGSTVRHAFFAGPFFGMLLSAEKVTRGVSCCSDGTQDVKQESAPVNMGFVVGSGVAIEAGAGDIVIDLQFSRGLTSVDREEEIKTSVFSVLAGYVFNF